MRYKLFVALSSVCFTLSATAGSVKSMSGETVVKGPAGAEYRASEVNCGGRKDDRVIWRKASGGDWCGKEVEGFCASRKMSAAKMVCDRAYDRAIDALAQAGETSAQFQAVTEKAVAEKQPEAEGSQALGASMGTVNKADDELVRQKEQLAIERERLKLEQDRLELRRQQMELQKQELEMKRQMEAQQKVEKAVKAQPKPEAAAPVQIEKESVEPKPSSGVKKNVLGM